MNMNKKSQVIGIACLATLATASASAMETELQLGEQDNVVAGFELLNKHYTNNVVRHDDVTGHGFFTGRWNDIGLTLDGFAAVDGGTQSSGLDVGTGETTEATARLDYLLEVTGIVQILPFFEISAYPNISGKAPFYWLGTDVWYLFPFMEGLEFGASAAYNLNDETNSSRQEHHWIGSFGARYFYQDAPLDYVVWGLFNLASRSYHEITSGTDKQGFTTFNVGGKLTLPLPWDQWWTFLRLESNWWLNSSDRDAVKAVGGDSSEVILGIGAEFRSL